MVIELGNRWKILFIPKNRSLLGLLSLVLLVGVIRRCRITCLFRITQWHGMNNARRVSSVRIGMRACCYVLKNKRFSIVYNQKRTDIDVLRNILKQRAELKCSGSIRIKILTEPVPRCNVDICVVSWGIILYCGLLGSADGIICNNIKSAMNSKVQAPLLLTWNYTFELSIKTRGDIEETERLF